MKEQLLSMLIQADIFTAEEPDSKKINEMDPKKLYKDKEGRKLFVDHYDFTNEEIIIALLAKQTLHLKHIKIIVITSFILGLLGIILALSLQ